MSNTITPPHVSLMAVTGWARIWATISHCLIFSLLLWQNKSLISGPVCGCWNTLTVASAYLSRRVHPGFTFLFPHLPPHSCRLSALWSCSGSSCLYNFTALFLNISIYSTLSSSFLQLCMFHSAFRQINPKILQSSSAQWTSGDTYLKDDSSRWDNLWNDRDCGKMHSFIFSTDSLSRSGPPTEVGMALGSVAFSDVFSTGNMKICPALPCLPTLSVIVSKPNTVHATG